MYLMDREGFIYTIAVDIYAFCLAFSPILHCVLHHFTLHLAPKRVLVTVRLNKNTFYRHVQLPPFDTKTNLRENRFFATR